MIDTVFWMEAYESLKARGSVSLPEGQYQGVTQIDNAVMKRAIENACHAVADELQAYLPTGYTPPTDARRQHLIAAVTWFAHGGELR
ncbi:hypothetical protein J3A72_000460 [Stenotrophomonas sp. PvP093]|uniref:hypothetical protein n=1 Tax=unclassified Stenotrophomonas TaxID=196198 RepID=UPI001AE6F5CC|nr:hypothetical protein [Stenotrophomonas sp. PvP093]MBP2480168.1 hypothetical protein [Stenotrophomonas sp. PvP093]